MYGTPESFVRAGALGLPLMVAIIGGETARFRPLIDLTEGHPRSLPALVQTRHSEALGGIDRFTFQMDNAGLNHEQLLNFIEIISKEVIPLVNSNK